MADDSFRNEFDARFATAEARASLHEVRTDAKFVELLRKIERLVEEVQTADRRAGEYHSQLVAEGRTTRLTMIATLIASLLAFAGVILTAQSNLLAAFQAGLARQAAVSAAPATPGKATVADAR